MQPISPIAKSRLVWLGVIVSVAMNTGWVLWTWHDQTLAQFAGSHMRESTATDHAASIVFAFGRVVLSLIVLENYRGF
jgi:hypothetical protein